VAGHRDLSPGASFRAFFREEPHSEGSSQEPRTWLTGTQPKTRGRATALCLKMQSPWYCPQGEGAPSSCWHADGTRAYTRLPPYAHTMHTSHTSTCSTCKYIPVAITGDGTPLSPKHWEDRPRGLHAGTGRALCRQGTLMTRRGLNPSLESQAPSQSIESKQTSASATQVRFSAA
jgi:hypothetical protein